MPHSCHSDENAKLNILITGKSPVIHTLMPILHDFGHAVSITRSPRETLFTYASQQPDLVIMAEQDDTCQTFTSIREVNEEAEALFIIDTAKPESFEPLFDFSNISFLPSSAPKEKLLTFIKNFQAQHVRKKKHEDDAKLFGLIMQSLPFPALLISTKTEKTILANKAAHDQLPAFEYEQAPPFMSALSDEVRQNLFSDLESYHLHYLKSVNAYERFWDLTIDQVAPSIFMLLAVDVTEQRQQLQLREEMERIARHDLRSPTANIVGMSRILETEAGLTKEFQQLAEIVRKTSERMIRQIDTSLTLIRLETGSLKADAHPFNLYNAITAAIGDLSQLAEDKHLTIVSQLDGEPLTEECSIVCYGEASLIITMFSNLLKNAAEAAPENSTITINITEDSRFITTKIHNFGEIPVSIRDTFFDRYATYGKKKGTGLGTYSARLIASGSGGDISFTTSEEKGTTLITTIPKPPIK
ncbi:sensor histidine kinase KdpD [Desulfovibrio sp. JC022]|uniref:sensor histidine kinase n=1 Tax=Desulfovibrio sp. JC022 TaxID=2593642 RepID=UPI0013D7A6ED|nr:HAMP domain-containing sensor histidine kinase [Desulfovibrio sp. JC022]NDV22907.1 HAMP domain-containing histidine kinase [Desulfovibrio sp. JC022]